MASPLLYKVYVPQFGMVASTRFLDDALTVARPYIDATVRLDGRIIYSVKKDGEICMAEALLLARERIIQHSREAYNKFVAGQQ